MPPNGVGARKQNTHTVMIVCVHTLLISATLIILGATNLHAAIITNLDTSPHTLTIAGKDPDIKHNLPPGEKVENICPEGCVLRLDASNEDDYIIEGAERLSIENNTLYYEGTITKPKQNDLGNREGSADESKSAPRP